MLTFLKRASMVILLIITGMYIVNELRESKKFFDTYFNNKTKLTMPHSQSDQVQYLVQLINNISL